MARPQITADIMSTNVYSCTTEDHLDFAHKLMREHNIRHLPVVNSESGDYVGLITQREILKQAFSAAAKVGIEHLEEAQKSVSLKEVMSCDVETIQPQLPLLEAGRYFTESKHGCLPVVVDGKLKGILTSADFVKLAVTLLSDG